MLKRRAKQLRSQRHKPCTSRREISACHRHSPLFDRPAAPSSDRSAPLFDRPAPLFDQPRAPLTLCEVRNCGTRTAPASGSTGPGASCTWGCPLQRERAVLVVSAWSGRPRRSSSSARLAVAEGGTAGPSRRLSKSTSASCSLQRRLVVVWVERVLIDQKEECLGEQADFIHDRDMESLVLCTIAHRQPQLLLQNQLPTAAPRPRRRTAQALVEAPAVVQRRGVARLDLQRARLVGNRLLAPPEPVAGERAVGTRQWPTSRSRACSRRLPPRSAPGVARTVGSVSASPF